MGDNRSGIPRDGGDEATLGNERIVCNADNAVTWVSGNVPERKELLNEHIAGDSRLVMQSASGRVFERFVPPDENAG